MTQWFCCKFCASWFTTGREEWGGGFPSTISPAINERDMTGTRLDHYVDFIKSTYIMELSVPDIPNTISNQNENDAGEDSIIWWFARPLHRRFWNIYYGLTNPDMNGIVHQFLRQVFQTSTFDTDLIHTVSCMDQPSPALGAKIAAHFLSRLGRARVFSDHTVSRRQIDLKLWKNC